VAVTAREITQGTNQPPASIARHDGALLGVLKTGGLAFA
jgi:hypothetical protein